MIISDYKQLMLEAITNFFSGMMPFVVTGSLLIIGLIGTILPFLPGHLLLFFAAVAHWMMLGEKSGLNWLTLGVLGGLLIISQIFEFISGAVGTRWFGGTKWGAIGAIIGGIVGLFFMPLGLIFGPLLGSMLCEFVLAKKEIRPATVSGVGSVVGTIAGLIFKIIIGIAMIAWLIADVFWIDYPEAQKSPLPEKEKSEEPVPSA